MERQRNSPNNRTKNVRKTTQKSEKLWQKRRKNRKNVFEMQIKNSERKRDSGREKKNNKSSKKYKTKPSVRMYLEDNFYLWRRAKGGGVGGAEGSQLLLGTEKKLSIGFVIRFSIIFYKIVAFEGRPWRRKGFYSVPLLEFLYIFLLSSFFAVFSVQTRNIEWNICVCGSIKSGADIRRRRRSWQSDEVIFWLLLKTKTKKQSPDASWTFPVCGKGFPFGFLADVAPAQMTHCIFRSKPWVLHNWFDHWRHIFPLTV